MIFSILASSQELCFENYNSRSGLPSSQVYDMFQDKNGDIWFATDRGIAKFDGTKFKHFDSSNGLTSNTIFDFFPQKDGSVWCSTINNSWFYFENGTEKFTKYKFSDTLQKYSYNSLPEEILIKENGNICVGFEDINGFLEINSNGKVLHQIFPGKNGITGLFAVANQFQKDYFHYYVQERLNESEKSLKNKNHIYISNSKLGYKKAAHINGEFVLSSNQTLFTKKKNSKTREFDLGIPIIGIGRYDSDHLWVGFKGSGVKIFDMLMREKSHYLKNEFVTDLVHDEHGGIWISTLFNGVYYVKNVKVKKISSDEDFYVYQIIENKKHQIAVATNKKEHFLLKNNKLILVYTDQVKESLKMYFDERTKNFEKNIKNVITINDPALNSRFSIIDVSENPKKPILIGSARAIIYQNKNKKLVELKISQRVVAVEYAKMGFYYGSYDGIYLFDTIEKKEIKLKQKEFQTRITDIKLIDGYHFIGTSGNGVLRYNEETGEIIKILTKNGLTSNIINEIYAESKNCIWVATNNGLNKIIFSGKTFKIQTLTKKNGLPNEEITDIHKDGDILWIGTSTGLLKINDSDFSFVPKKLNLHLYWEGFESNGAKINKQDLLDLRHDVKNLKFKCHFAFFGGAENIEFRYKLIGLDSKWNYSAISTITFNSLNPGEYELILQAKTLGGEWGQNQVKIKIKIYPPFYASWWFISLIILSIGLLTYFFFRIRIFIYNKDLVRELLRLLIKKISPKTNSFLIWSQGKEIRINSSDVLFFKAEGNYLEVMTLQKKYTFRYKIGEIENLVPDKLEYIRVHRSYVVRLDKITGKSLEDLEVQGHTVPIGKTYKVELRNLTF